MFIFFSDMLVKVEIRISFDIFFDIFHLKKLVTSFAKVHAKIVVKLNLLSIVEI